jgi:hypothetical protein
LDTTRSQRSLAVLEIVGLIDRNAVGKPVGLDRTAAGRDRFRIDVGEAERLAQVVREQGEADEARAGAPLEHTPLFRHAAALQERDEALADSPPAPVEMLLVMHRDGGEPVFPIRKQRPEERIDMAAPELFEQVCCEHFDLRTDKRPHKIGRIKPCQPDADHAWRRN